MSVMKAAPLRQFAIVTKYKFDENDWTPTPTQASAATHLTNAEELVNDLPIIETSQGVVRCTGVN